MHLSLKAWNLLSALCGNLPACIRPGCCYGPFPILGSPSLCEPHWGSVLCARDDARHFYIASFVGKMPPPTHTQERLWWSREVKSLPEFLKQLRLLHKVNSCSLVSHFVSMVSGLWSLAYEQGTMTVILASASVSQRGQWFSPGPSSL